MKSFSPLDCKTSCDVAFLPYAGLKTLKFHASLFRLLRTLRTHRFAAASGPYPLMLAALGGVWATNFFVILPMVSPAFVHMVSYAVSLTSRLLFGLAAAAALQWRTNCEPAPAMNPHASAATNTDNSDCESSRGDPPPCPAQAGRAADFFDPLFGRC